ncbi:MAG: hypothetical protein D3906_15230 [Candidatus Electrothrix sp. AUS1_2]|nr:hypothetical protein [Candidatus Electrothrix sp. AUS1_2]
MTAEPELSSTSREEKSAHYNHSDHGERNNKICQFIFFGSATRQRWPIMILSWSFFGENIFNRTRKTSLQPVVVFFCCQINKEFIYIR